MRNFKWYRKRKGGKWWRVKEYHTYKFTWIHETDNIDFPEFDNLFMDDVGVSYPKGLIFTSSFSFLGYKGMEDTPTEDYTRGKKK